MSLQCQGLHEHVWKETSEGKRKYTFAMIRRLVNGFVHDLRPPQHHIFLSESDCLLSASLAVIVASPAQETEDGGSPAERERVRKLIPRLHVAGGHVSNTSLRLLLERRGCPVWVQRMVISCSVIRVWKPVALKMHNESRWLRIGRLSTESFLYTVHGCSLQTVVVFTLSARESSAAFRAEWCDSQFHLAQMIGCSITHSSSF